MALNMQIVHPLKNKQPEKQCEIQQQNEGNVTHPYLEKKEIFEQQVKTIIIPISTYRNKQTHNTKSRCKKNRGCLVQLYEANHLYLMNIALIKKNLHEKHHLKISSISSEDDLSYQKHRESSKFRR
jgi:hypothetical protein